MLVLPSLNDCERSRHISQLWADFDLNWVSRKTECQSRWFCTLLSHWTMWSTEKSATCFNNSHLNHTLSLFLNRGRSFCRQHKGLHLRLRSLRGFETFEDTSKSLRAEREGAVGILKSVWQQHTGVRHTKTQTKIASATKIVTKPVCFKTFASHSVD